MKLKLLFILVLLISGCSHYYTRESGEWAKLPVTGCVFGGTTVQADLACAEKNFGNPLLALNDYAKRSGGDCKSHVRRVLAMKPNATVLHTPGHVSALVDGHVLDNGALGMPGDVMSFEDFKKWYGPDFTIIGTI